MSDWPAVVEAIATVCVAIFTVAGFIMVIRQLQVLGHTIRSESNGKLSEQSIAILNFIADRPHLYDYLYNGKPLTEGDASRVEVLCLCEMVANYSDLVVSLTPDLAKVPRERWQRFIIDTAAKSPAFREFVQEHRHWYSDELLNIIGS